MDDPPKAEESATSATEAAPTSAPTTVDADSPREVRVTFIVLMLAAAALCAVPRQWGSAIILLGMAVLAAVFHFVRGKRR